MSNVHNVIIIGGGPAGLTAAIYTARAELAPLVFQGMSPGGQLMLTSDIENFPGFPEGIGGAELMDNMAEQAERFGAELKMEEVTAVDLKSRPFTVTSGGQEYQARSLIVATGADVRWLGLESEQRLIGKGVSSCAVCDAAFYKDKKVFVIGGGDSAMEEALVLTKFASEVSIVHRREELRASKVMQERVMAHPKIELILSSELVEVLGEDRVGGVRLKNKETGEESEYPADGVFIAIGHIPNTKLYKDSGLRLDESGYVLAKERTATDVEGVFVAGDVADHQYQQAITAAAGGCQAALDCEEWLRENE